MHECVIHPLLSYLYRKDGKQVRFLGFCRTKDLLRQAPHPAINLEPERHLKAFADAGADRLIVHQEACPHLHRTLQSIRELKVEAGVSINPGTHVVVLEEVLDLADLIQVMTVNPGWGGQPFLHSQLDKIRRLRRMLDERELDIPIGVDGGISPIAAPLVVSAGATVLVAGSSVYNDKAPVAENVAALRASVT